MQKLQKALTETTIRGASISLKVPQSTAKRLYNLMTSATHAIKDFFISGYAYYKTSGQKNEKQQEENFQNPEPSMGVILNGEGPQNNHISGELKKKEELQTYGVDKKQYKDDPAEFNLTTKASTNILIEH